MFFQAGIVKLECFYLFANMNHICTFFTNLINVCIVVKLARGSQTRKWLSDIDNR